MSTPPRLALRGGSILVVAALAVAALTLPGAAGAAVVPTVPLATAASYSVLGGQTVTNTGPSVLGQGLGLSPGTSITGFPPGTVLGTTNATNAAAAQANATTTADLAGLQLQGGVYAGPSHGALSLSGTLTLDAAGDPSTTFVFQTNSSLITATGSTVSLVNGAQECNVFWQVGSSATLGTGSTFVGNVLALTSITVNGSVTVHGRALARNGAVTLDTDTFTRPTCATSPVTTTTTTGAGTPTGGPGTPPGTGPGTSPGPGTGTPTGIGQGGTAGPGVPGVTGAPRTGAAPVRTTATAWMYALFAAVVAGAAMTPVLTRRHRAAAERH